MTSNADIFATHILTRAGRTHFTALATPQLPTTAQSVLAEHGDCKADAAAGYNPVMGFSKRKMEERRRQAAEKEAAARHANEKQILEDAEHLVAVCTVPWAATLTCVDLGQIDVGVSVPI
jgi:hypothetical protein